MAKQKPYAVQLSEASLAARLRNMVVERDKLSALREREGLRDRYTFYTAKEVNEIRAEHDAELKAFAISAYHPDGPLQRIAELAHTALTNPAAQQSWAETQAAARLIVKTRDRR